VPSAWLLFAVLVGYGVADAVTDVSMNVAGVKVQRRLGRSVLNSMHGIWSIAAVVGGLTGSAAAALGVTLPLHLGAVGALCALLAILAMHWVPDVSGHGVRTKPRPSARFSPALGGLAGGLALATALVLGGTVPGIVAFAILGLGSAAVFPAMITAAGSLPGQSVQAMNMATRVGFLAAPPLVGLVADAVGLRAALGLLVVPAALALALFAGAVAVRR
jgi:hypothetical protein